MYVCVYVCVCVCGGGGDGGAVGVGVVGGGGGAGGSGDGLFLMGHYKVKMVLFCSSSKRQRNFNPSVGIAGIVRDNYGQQQQF